ncbi:MAG TPA: DUF922 domain-containing protein, partial [Gemmatimonadaceae bacterium]|nr:DUF922 domain-containing protein [Gemmatimonadaceae bacterium]
GIGCSPVGTEVILKVVVTVPQWADPARAETSDALRAEWARFRSALLVHEANHADVTVAEANRLADRLREPQAATCWTLQSEMQHMAQRSIKLIRERNDDYDQRTQHGRTEGAVLGPISSR